MAHGRVKFKVQGYDGEFTLSGGKITAPGSPHEGFMQYMAKTALPLRGEQYEPDTDMQLAKRLQRYYGARMTITEHIPPTFGGGSYQ